MDDIETEQNWRLRPVFRVGAWVITLFGAFTSGIAVFEFGWSVFLGEWRDAAFIFGLAGAVCGVWWLTYGRLIALAAWTGEEPAVDFE